MREQEREVINVESQQITNPTIGSLLITVLDMEGKHDVMEGLHDPRPSAQLHEATIHQ